MADLNRIANACNNRSAFTINGLCKIKTYLTVEEKIAFAKEYREAVEKHINDYPKYESFIAFVFFNLMVVKHYTDIKLDLTYEEFDKLQSNNLINQIVEKIGDDYSLLLRLIQIDI